MSKQYAYAVYFQSILAGVVGKPGMISIYFNHESAQEEADNMNATKHISGRYTVVRVEIKPVKGK